jgi:hypothetical protein
MKRPGMTGDSDIPEKLKTDNSNFNMRYRGKNFFQNGRLVLFFLVLIGTSVISCRSTKKITKAISTKSGNADTSLKKVDTLSMADLHEDSLRYISHLYNHIRSGMIDCKTFSAKLKVHYEGSDGKDYTFTAFIHLQKDKIIWISATSVLGEAFRVMITPDSVKVLNKIDKIYQLRSVNYIKEISHLPFDFSELQAIILGNPIYLDSNILFYRKDPQGTSILSIGRVFRNYLTLNNGDLSLKHSKLDDIDPLKARSCDITYGDYEKVDTVVFSSYRKIVVAEKARLDVELSFNKYSFNENLEFPFNIPKNYKRN